MSFAIIFFTVSYLLTWHSANNFNSAWNDRTELRMIVVGSLESSEKSLQTHQYEKEWLDSAKLIRSSLYLNFDEFFLCFRYFQK
jgi:hypothetical protein